MLQKQQGTLTRSLVSGTRGWPRGGGVSSDIFTVLFASGGRLLIEESDINGGCSFYEPHFLRS
jgi:hypothetical protein